MEDVKWLEVTLDTTEAELDALCARLTGNGVTGLAIEDEEDFKTFWSRTTSTGLRGRRPAGPHEGRLPGEVLHHRRRRRPGSSLRDGWRASTNPIRSPAWGTTTGPTPGRSTTSPCRWGRGSTSCPSGSGESPSRRGKAPLYLNPGLTFGTGSHASTQLCLMGLERYTVPGKPVLDLGCGSGILSIAALVLGASAAAAVDIDPKAVDVAYENAALNGIGRDRYTVRAGNVLTDGAWWPSWPRQKYALVLANIVADVIIPLSARAGEFLDTDGVFLCSGIIDTRAGEVEAALERNGLACLSGGSRTAGWP